jgi:hypothetical protein
MAARHFKYTYNSELPPRNILSKMIKANLDDSLPDNNTQKTIDFTNERNKLYFSRRKELKNLMKSINSHLDNNSQSYFLTLYYMDLIFTNPNLERVFFSHFSTWINYTTYNDIQMNNYVLLSLACLVVASKFNENDPHIPTMSSFIRLLYEYSKKKYIYNLESLFLAELVVVKLLKYKLNYYTIYHHLIFFFTHGIVFKKTIEKSVLSKKYSEMKILEKIYILSRELLDVIIDSDKNYDLFVGKNNYIVVVEIFLWSIEKILRIKIKDDENIFKLIFNINIPQAKHKEIYGIFEKLSNKKKGNSENNTVKLTSKNPPMSNSKQIAELNNNQTAINTMRVPSSEINFKFTLEPKSSVSSTTSYSNSKTYHKIIDNMDNDFQFYNGLIQDELEGFNSNCPYKFVHHQNNQNIPVIKREKRLPQSNIIYGKNNKVFLTTSKSINKGLNSNENSLVNPNLKRMIYSNKNLDIKPYKINKEPIDSNKSLNLLYDKNQNINPNYYDKILFSNDLEKNRKKALSCSKDGNMALNYQIRPSANINSNIKTSAEINSNFNIKNNFKKVDINKKNIYESKKDINNFYELSPNLNKNKGENLIIKKKDGIFKKYQKVNNNEFLQNKSYNQNFLSDKIVTKYMFGDAILNQAKNVLENANLNSVSAQEPKDNDKRASNSMYFIDKGMKDKISQSYNKANTIIINNNIHINTYIDKNNLNENGTIKGSFNKNNPNLFLFEHPQDKKITEMMKGSNPSNKNRNIRIKQNNMNPSKSTRNNNVKSNLPLSQRV